MDIDNSCSGKCSFIEMDGSTGNIRRVYYFIFGLQKTTRMNYSVHINVMPLKDLLDPQGKAVLGGLGNLGMNSIEDVRIGKHIMLQVQPEANYIFGNQTFYGPPEQRFKMDAAIVPSFLVGAGAVFHSGKGSFMVSYFYDVLQKPNSPYGGQPFLTFGYNVSLH